MNYSKTDYPYLMEGEIISVNKKNPKLGRDVILYTCAAYTREGSKIIIPNVEDCSIYGGISDYSRRMARSRKDSDYKADGVTPEEVFSSVGERVYILPLDGDLLRGIIVAYKQHEYQIEEPELFEKVKKVEQYLGLRKEYDEKGRLRITRKGAPKVSYAPNMKSPSGEKFPGDDSPAVTPAPRDEKLVVEFLDKALFRVRDPEGGMIEIDHAGYKKGVYISNNDWKSDENPDTQDKPKSGGLSDGTNSTDAEYVWLNRERKLVLINARKTIQLYSFGARKDVTDGNHSYKIGGDSVINVAGNETLTVGKTYKLSVGGSAKLTMGDGKIAFGANGIEVVDMLIQLADQLIQTLTAIQAMTMLGNLGYPTSPPINIAQFATAQGLVTQIKTSLELIKGSL